MCYSGCNTLLVYHRGCPTCRQYVVPVRVVHAVTGVLHAVSARRIVGTAFANDKTFQNALNTAFEHFINLSPRAPEYISLFMDDQLRKARLHAHDMFAHVPLDPIGS